MKGKEKMKRVKRYSIILAASLLCTTVLTGCGSPSGESGSRGGLFGDDSSGKDLFEGDDGKESGESSEEGMDFADPGADGPTAEGIVPGEQYKDFKNLGNNPNNLYQSNYCPAFDEEHIYWCEKEKVVQMKRDGTEAHYIGEGDGFLNVYDGWLYTVTNGYIKELDRHKLEICRINLETFEEEVLATYKAGSTIVRPQCCALLVANGFVFYSVHNGWNRQWVGMLDIEPDYIDDRPLRNLKDVGTTPRNVEMSVGGDYLYVFIGDDSNSYDREVWRENLSSPFTRDAWSQVVGSINGEMYGSWIFTPEGFHRYNRNRYNGNGTYITKLYDTINAEEMTWDSSDSLCSEVDRNKFGSKCPRFLIGDTLFLLEPYQTRNTNETNIYRYDHFDFQNGTLVTSAAVVSMFPNYEAAIYGIYQDSLYLVELSNDGSNVIQIRADGTVESSMVQPQERN